MTEEMVIRLWDDQSGERIEVSEDADGLDLVQITHVDANGEKLSGPVLFKPEEAQHIASAIERVAAFIRERNARIKGNEA